ncbi:MAG: acetate/propionate family kinase [Syntrophorhabdales bacterium]
MTILTVNSGSSSVKFALFEMGRTEKRHLTGEIDRIGLKGSLFATRNADGQILEERHQNVFDHNAALDLLFEWLRTSSPASPPDAVGHRIVHGGSQFLQPHIVTAELVTALGRLTPLAPDHLPHELKAIRAVMRSYPALAQVACFDTAFHRHMPKVARLYPLPRFLWTEGVRRYGFHGLSYEYIMGELDKEAGTDAARGLVIVAHLGNGASMAAVREGKGIDTTMGFTPDGGLMMGTRPGDLDPGVILYLLQEKGLRPATVADIISRHSGLQAVSAMTSDMSELLRVEGAAGHAAEAIALFCYQAKKFAGAMAAALGGLDTFIFTGGIGENAPEVRERICDGLEFLGLTIDRAANAANKGIISRAGSRVIARVMKTDEELMIARHAATLLGKRTLTPAA